MRKKNTVCRAKKADGSACSAPALPGGEFCFFHDPDRAAERRAAQSLGGSRNRMKTLGDAAPVVTVKDCEDVVQLIVLTINQVRRGEIDPRVANAVGYLVNVAIRALEQSQIEKQLAKNAMDGGPLAIETMSRTDIQRELLLRGIHLGEVSSTRQRHEL